MASKPLTRDIVQRARGLYLPHINTDVSVRGTNHDQ